MARFSPRDDFRNLDDFPINVTGSEDADNAEILLKVGRGSREASGVVWFQVRQDNYHAYSAQRNLIRAIDERLHMLKYLHRSSLVSSPDRPDRYAPYPGVRDTMKCLGAGYDVDEFTSAVVGAIEEWAEENGYTIKRLEGKKWFPEPENVELSTVSRILSAPEP